MATLGDLLATARRDAAGFTAWIGQVDPDMAAALGLAAQDHALDVTGFVRLALNDFARLAPEEDWATLISAVRDASDPGMTCLSAMVQWRIAAPGCTGPRSLEGSPP